MNDTKQRSEAVNVRVDRDMKKALTKAAIQEKRTVSNLVIKVLSDWLERK